jgi:hypothetical protein
MEHLRSRLLVGERRDFYGFDVHGSHDSGSETVEKQCEGPIEKNDWERRRRFPVVTDGGFASSRQPTAAAASELLIGPCIACAIPIEHFTHQRLVKLSPPEQSSIDGHDGFFSVCLSVRLSVPNYLALHNPIIK